MNYSETVEWEGAGWYTSSEEGAYENTHIHTHWIGGDEEAPDTYTRGLGTPFFVESEQEMLNKNPKVKFNRRKK